MSLSTFSDKTHQPTDAELSTVLGSAFTVWKQLIQSISEQFAPITVEWGCSSGKTGWGLRLKGKKRTILYMVPCRGYFLASFALGEKAVKTIHDSGLPQNVLEVIDSAPKYAEGRGVRLQVRCLEDLVWVLKIADAKMNS
jgi:hypothetical protein